MHRISLVVSRACSLLAVHGLLIVVASLVAEHSLQSTDSVVMSSGMVAPWYVGSSQTRG